MHLIFCIDDRGGLSFCGRRLSRDREAVAHMLRMTAGSHLWIHPDSGDLFPAEGVVADPDYLTRAGPEDYCFVEKGPFPQVWKDLKSVTLYHWNRAYPSTEHFPRKLLENRKPVSTEEFPGYSHEKITMERFVP